MEGAVAWQWIRHFEKWLPDHLFLPMMIRYIYCNRIPWHSLIAWWLQACRDFWQLVFGCYNINKSLKYLSLSYPKCKLSTAIGFLWEFRENHCKITSSLVPPWLMLKNFLLYYHHLCIYAYLIYYRARQK